MRALHPNRPLPCHCHCSALPCPQEQERILAARQQRQARLAAGLQSLQRAARRPTRVRPPHASNRGMQEYRPSSAMGSHQPQLMQQTQDSGSIIRQ